MAMISKNQKTFDAIVVGRGYNGLVAASYLAKTRKAVLPFHVQDELAAQKIKHNR